MPPDAICPTPLVEQPTILFVDDEPGVLKAMGRLVRRKCWRALVANNANEALSMLAEHSVDVVVSDMRMPGMTGDELLARVREDYPDIMRILLSGHADVQALENSINNAGVYNYINKPWDDNILLEVVASALSFQHSERERKRLEALTRKQNRQLGRLALSLDKSVKERTIEIEQALTLLQMTHQRSQNQLNAALDVLIRVVQWADDSKLEHSGLVTELSVSVAKVLELSEENIDLTRIAASLHDIGVMSFPKSIRAKPVYKMTDLELATYHQHPQVAEMLLSADSSLAAHAKIIKQHREHVDGNGFPEGLKGADIALPAKIVCAASEFYLAVNGMLTDSVSGFDEALAFLEREAGKRYDERVVECLRPIIQQYSKVNKKRFHASVHQLRAGMLLEKDVHTEGGVLLLTKGTTLTEATIDKLINYQRKYECQFELDVSSSS